MYYELTLFITKHPTINHIKVDNNFIISI